MESDNKWQSLKKRYIGLDIFRLMAVIAILLMHTVRHLNADYGILQPFARMGAVFMTAFFMLSGFSLFVNYSAKNIIKLPELKSYFIKRVIGIVPMYYITAVLFVLFYFIVSRIYPTLDYSAKDDLLLFPVEFLGIQSNFHSLFDYSHNGMTWFISCLLMCYLVYPLMQEIAKQISNKAKVIIIVLSAFILLYSPIVQELYRTVFIYTNPFFRILEFMIGVLLASMKPRYEESTFVKKYIFNWVTVILAGIVMAVIVSAGVLLDLSVKNYMLYSAICLPFFIIMLIGSSGTVSSVLSGSKVIRYCCEISYVFFLAQLFSNTVCIILKVEFNITNNLVMILLGWIICAAIAVLMHEAFEKPLKKMLNKLADKRNNVK